MKISRHRWGLSLLVASLLLVSCTTVHQRSADPNASSLWPSGEEWRAAATRAMRDPSTWTPAAGAAVIAAGGWDHEISDWAVTHTPVFGSTENARSWSDDLSLATHVAMIASALTVEPRPDQGRFQARFDRLVDDHGILLVIGGTTRGLKEAAGRERPNEEDSLSFPSGHASRAFGYAALTHRNLEESSLAPRGRFWANTTTTTLAAATGWARIEAGAHYPTDVLVGAALGNFLAGLLHDAFLGENVAIRPSMVLSRDEIFIGVGISLRR